MDQNSATRPSLSLCETEFQLPSSYAPARIKETYETKQLKYLYNERQQVPTLFKKRHVEWFVHNKTKVSVVNNKFMYCCRCFKMHFFFTEHLVFAKQAAR
jgi:hypothetical protein